MIRFKSQGEDDKKVSPIIYTNPSLIQNNIKIIPNNHSALTYLDISLGIDGMGGFSCGEYFHIDGVPEIYNRNGYFQITNVKHGIEGSEWKTTIEAGYRIIFKEEDK